MIDLVQRAAKRRGSHPSLRVNENGLARRRIANAVANHPLHISRHCFRRRRRRRRRRVVSFGAPLRNAVGHDAAGRVAKRTEQSVDEGQDKDPLPLPQRHGEAAQQRARDGAAVVLRNELVLELLDCRLLVIASCPLLAVAHNAAQHAPLLLGRRNFVDQIADADATLLCNCLARIGTQAASAVGVAAIGGKARVALAALPLRWPCIWRTGFAGPLSHCQKKRKC